jgi:hypothetical protein
MNPINTVVIDIGVGAKTIQARKLKTTVSNNPEINVDAFARSHNKCLP